MDILNLTSDSRIYTANVYLVTGTHNAMDDINTLIDVGRDPGVIKKINNSATGVGKKRVEQVVLTHSHYDHVSLLPVIRKIFNPVVYAFSVFQEDIDRILEDGDTLKIGDKMFEIIYTPGHSNDSICLYCEADQVLFVGDTPVMINTADGFYPESFSQWMEKLCRRNVERIYFGHGRPILQDGNKHIRDSLKNIRKNRVKGAT